MVAYCTVATLLILHNILVCSTINLHNIEHLSTLHKSKKQSQDFGIRADFSLNLFSWLLI
jgi:hypothetical protein